MGDSPRSNEKLNGKVRLTNNRERIAELHKRLHNKQTHDAVLDSEFQPDQREHNQTKSARIRRADVKKYLGEPLPLPYLTSPRHDELKNERETCKNVQIKTPSQRHAINKLMKPLGQNTEIGVDGDIYKDKLRRSLKTFQKDKSEKKFIDRIVQTDEIPYEPLTPNTFKFPLSSVDSSPKSFNNSSDGLKLENSFEKDLLLNGFKLRNSSLTPDNISKPLTKLEPPLEVKSETKTISPPPKRAKEKKQIHLNCRSILGSPILLLILILVLYYYFKHFSF